MSHIKNIEIKNFKSISHATIEDCRRVNVFIGYPNVGKSNILEAMSLISYLTSDSTGVRYKELCRYKELIDIFGNGNKKKKAEIIADDFLFSLEYKSKNEIRFLIEDLNFKSRNVIVNSPESAAGIIKGVNREFLISKEGFLSHGTHSQSAHYERPKLKKYQFVGSNFEIQQDPTVLSFPFGSNLFEAIRHNPDLRKECGELFSSYNLKIVFDENENIIIQKQLDEFSAFQFSFSQVADTLQRLIFHKTAILTNQHTILLFEEPEAHMFPPYISKFTADVMYDNNQNQFFITTHSPFVLNDFMENLKNDELSIYVVGYKKETGETFVRKLSDNELHEIYQHGIDLYFNLENYLMHEQ